MIGKQLMDQIEFCSSLVDAPLRPKNVRFVSKWASTKQTGRTRTNCSNNLDELKNSNRKFLTSIQSIYSRLINFPIPNLLRPLCQWLGLYWLGQNDHNQAGHYFSQAVGIGATSLYLSILCSKAK